MVVAEDGGEEAGDNGGGDSDVVGAGSAEAEGEGERLDQGADGERDSLLASCDCGVLTAAV